MSEVRRLLAENLDAAQRVAARLRRSVGRVGALGPMTAATIERLDPEQAEAVDAFLRCLPLWCCLLSLHSLLTFDALMLRRTYRMASITIRNLDEGLKVRLRIRAAHHSRSMEEEVRAILRQVLNESTPGPDNLADSIRRRFVAVGGVELPLAPREAIREPPALDP